MYPSCLLALLSDSSQACNFTLLAFLRPARKLQKLLPFIPVCLPLPCCILRHWLVTSPVLQLKNGEVDALIKRT